jgi:hypothetical protein
MVTDNEQCRSSLWKSFAPAGFDQLLTNEKQSLSGAIVLNTLILLHNCLIGSENRM